MRGSVRCVAAGVLAAGVGWGGPVLAQSRGPSDNGGIYGGTAHEPVPSRVIPEERRAGVAPDAAQAKQGDRTVDRLDQQLLHEEQTNPPTRSSAPPLTGRQ